MPDLRRGMLRASYPERAPTWEEEAFFSRSPRVSGYAADDGRVVLSPFSGLPREARDSVALNEAARLRMMDTGRVYDFPVTDQQRKFFANTPYASQPQMMRHTIVARALSGDASAAPYPPAQQAEVESVLSGLMPRKF